MVFAFSPVVSAMTAILTDPTTTATIYIYFQKIRYICMDAPFPRSNSADETWDPFKSATLETKLFSGTYFSTIFLPLTTQEKIFRLLQFFIIFVWYAIAIMSNCPHTSDSFN